MLTKVLERDEEVPKILTAFYDLYCHGYSFLDNLGLKYGLDIAVPYTSYGVNDWDDLTAKQKEELRDSIYPSIEIEIKKVISWVANGRVILTGEKDEMNNYYYVDNRSTEESQPTTYQRDSQEKRKV